MFISELITLLEEFKAEQGDLPVLHEVCYDSEVVEIERLDISVKTLDSYSASQSAAKLQVGLKFLSI